MLTARDITASGYFWYFDGSDAPPVVVWVGPEDAPRHELGVFFHGRQDYDLLTEMGGWFAGPVLPPAV